MLRDFQQALVQRVFAEWQAGQRNVCLVAPTGAGKTVMLGHVITAVGKPTAVIAHRQELVGQLSLALNREGVKHGLICPDPVIRQIVALHMDLNGRSHYTPRATVRVGSVQTLIARDLDPKWKASVRLVVVDEGHHVIAANSWGKAIGLFPYAHGLFPTAHALRADGQGLGREADGLADALVVGPSCRDLINRGFLSDYRLIAAPVDIDLSGVTIGSSGEYSGPKLRDATHRSKKIVGDVVSHYLKFGAGKLGITFAVDVEAAGELTAAYNACGVPAATITANTPIDVRGQYMREFRNRELLQLVNVDVLGEGVDVPAVEVVSMARATASFQTYSQQFGRALRVSVDPHDAIGWNDLGDAERLRRIAAGPKPRAIIIDHVGNWAKHGLPDVARDYTLERAERKSRRSIGGVPLRACLSDMCLQPYPAHLIACPYCATPKPEPAGRGSPELVEGDLLELDPDVLRELRGEVARIDGDPVFPPHTSAEADGAIKRRHWERQQAQHKLRHLITLWAGYWRDRGEIDRSIYRRFWHTFGTDIATAQTLGTGGAAELTEKIADALKSYGVPL